MTVNDFIQKPTNNKTYALNKVPAFIVNVNVSVRATLWLDGDPRHPIYVAIYSPDFNGQVTIDFEELYKECLGTAFPSGGYFTQDNFGKLFHVNVVETVGEFLSGYTGVNFQYYVVNTRLKASAAFSTWCHTHFLTNQPLEKITTHEAPEWLTFYNPGDRLDLKVRFYTKSGNHIDYLVRSTTQEGCYSENVRYSQVIKFHSGLPGSLLGYYDIILIDDSQHELMVQRYIYREYTGLEKYFCFVNDLGGIDTLICQGANTLKPEITHNIGRFGGQYLPLDDTDDVRIWSQNSGMMPYRQRDWVYELFAAKKEVRKYEPSDGSFNAIVVKSSEISMGDDDQLASCTFTYIYKDESGGVNTQGVHNILHQSTVVKQEEMEDLTQNVEMEIEDDTTEPITVNANKVFVEYTTRGTLSRQEPIYYYIGDAVEPSGRFIPGEQEIVVIEIEEGQTIRFATENSDIDKISIKYYES